MNKSQYLERITAIRDMTSFNLTIREIELEIISYEKHMKRAQEELRFRLDLGARAQ